MSLAGQSHNLPKVVEVAYTITLVDPPRNRIEGYVKDGALIPIQIKKIDAAFIWPQVGETWIIRRENYDWVLGSRVQGPDDPNPAVSSIAPGEGYFHAKEVTLSSGNQVVNVDTSQVLPGQVPIWSASLGSAPIADPIGGWTTGTIAINRTGIIDTFAGAVAPAGAFMCDGALYSRTTQAGLFAVIGTTYGAGDGSTTFAVPNIPAGTSPIQQGGGFVLGATGGEATHTLSDAEMPFHSHGGQTGSGATGSGATTGGTADLYDPSHVHPYTVGGVAIAGGIAAGNLSVNYGSNAIQGAFTGIYDRGHAHFVSSLSVPSLSINSDGGGAAHNNMSPWIAMNFIIWT